MAFCSSYTQDPPFALLFTYVWVSAAGFCILLALPRLVRSFRNGRFIAGIRGIGWDYNASPDYQAVRASEKGNQAETPARRPMGPADWLRGVITAMATWSLYSPPYLRLDVGQRALLAQSHRTVYTNSSY